MHRLRLLIPLCALLLAALACDDGGSVGLTAAPGDTGLRFSWPVPGATVVRGFGCSAVYTGERDPSCPADAPWFHNGLDLAAPAGALYLDPLPAAGRVAYAGTDTLGPDCEWLPGSLPPHTGYGIYVKHTALIDGQTVEVWGAHLARLATHTGAETVPGQPLGVLGASGCSTAPHLHLSVRIDGVYVDPLRLFDVSE